MDLCKGCGSSKLVRNGRGPEGGRGINARNVAPHIEKAIED